VESIVAKSRRTALTFLALGLGVVVAMPAAAQSRSPDDWSWRAAINLWLPNVKMTSLIDLPGGGNIVADTDPGSYLEKLKFVFMGSLDGHRGPYSAFADIVYLDFGDLKSEVRTITGPGGAVSIPVDSGTHSDLKGFVGTFAGGYAISQTPGARHEAFAGLRYTKMKVRLNWHLNGSTGILARDGTVEESKDFFDGVVGLRGRSDLGGPRDFRYYADVGTGTSQLTWQAMAGVGYRFTWGDAVLGYRHLAYDLQSDRPISDAAFSGPQLVIGFTF
jgi:hypothetical protein